MRVSCCASAKRRTLKGLKEDCQRVVAASVADDAEWAQRLHDSRAVYRWNDNDGGAPRLDARFSPTAGAYVFSALDAETDRVFREARAAGRHEPRAAYMHDALVNLITNGPTKPIDVRLSADATAIARGHVLNGERCEIDGIGPIPVTAARADARRRPRHHHGPRRRRHHPRLLDDPHHPRQAAPLARGDLPPVRPQRL